MSTSISTDRLRDLCGSYYSSSTNKPRSGEFIEWIMNIISDVIIATHQSIEAEFLIADVWSNYPTLVNKIRTEFDTIMKSKVKYYVKYCSIDETEDYIMNNTCIDLDYKNTIFIRPSPSDDMIDKIIAYTTINKDMSADTLVEGINRMLN